MILQKVLKILTDPGFLGSLIGSTIAIGLYKGNLKDMNTKETVKQKTETFKEFKLIQVVYNSCIKHDLKQIINELGKEIPKVDTINIHAQLFDDIKYMVEKIELKNMTHENEIFSNAVSFIEDYQNLRSQMVSLINITESELQDNKDARLSLRDSFRGLHQRITFTYKFLEAKIN